MSWACYAESTSSSNIYEHGNVAALKNKLLYLKNGDIWIADISKGIHEQLTAKKDITNYCISYDLTKMIFVRNFSSSYELDLVTGVEKHVTDLETDMSNPSISPVNDKVVYTSKSLKEFYTSPINKAFKQRVRHLWLIDLKSRKKIDLTEDSPKQYSAPKWSPDGRRISFTSSSWDVYIKNMVNSSEGIVKVGAGYFSEWLNEKTLAIGGPEAINVYNIEKMEKINEAKFQPGFYPADFSFGISNKLYYEDQTENPDIDLSYVNIETGQKGKIVEDAKNPLFVK